jgi:hypothetical protein
MVGRLEGRGLRLTVVWVTGTLGALSTFVQLYLRFSERRPFRTSPRTATSLVGLCLIAGCVSGAVAWIPLLPVGQTIAGVTLGLGSTVPLARSPGTSVRARTGRSSGPAKTVNSFLIELWKVGAFWSDRLDAMLAAAKHRRVSYVVAQIDELTRRDRCPPFERINAMLAQIVADHTERTRERYRGRLDAAYANCKRDPNPLTKLISLAYDMNVEGLVLEQVRVIVERGLKPTAGTASRRLKRTS